MASSDLHNALPILASSEDEGDFDVIWLEPPPSSDMTSRQSEPDGSSGLPAASRFHSCEYCPWGYFGNEASDVDLYTYAALHVEIPAVGRGVRRAEKPKRKPAKRARPGRKRKTGGE
jgi:hypothetical protein